MWPLSCTFVTLHGSSCWKEQSAVPFSLGWKCFMKSEPHISSRCSTAAAEAGVVDAAPGGWHSPTGVLHAPAWQTRTAAHSLGPRSGLGTDELERQTVLPLRATWRSWTPVRRASDQHHSMMSFLMKVWILKQIYRDILRGDAGEKWIFLSSPHRALWLLD